MKLARLRKAISLVTVLLLLSVWSTGGNCKDISKSNKPLFAELNKIATGKTRIIEIPTYDGSNQVVHPDILVKDNTFYLVITPYPYSNHDYENPSLFISQNGIEFHPPKGVTNPIMAKQDQGHNDDPDILFDSKKQMFYLYYLETRRYSHQHVVLLNSTDGVNWSQTNCIEYLFRKGDPFIVSPSVIKKDKDYRMFYVDITKIPHKIRYIKSSDGKSWNSGKPYRIRSDYPFSFSPWHIDLFEHNDKYYMLVNGYWGVLWHKQYLYLAVSDNLVDWHFRKEPIISPSKAFYNSAKIYRSTGLIHNNNMFIWFSFKTYAGSWHLGVKKISLKNLNLE